MLMTHAQNVQRFLLLCLGPFRFSRVSNQCREKQRTGEMNNNDVASGELSKYHSTAPPRREEQVAQELQTVMDQITKIRENLLKAEEETEEIVKRSNSLSEKYGKTVGDLNILTQLEVRYLNLQPQIVQWRILLQQLEAEARVLENEYNLFINHKIDYKAITERIYGVMALQRADEMKQSFQSNLNTN